MRSDKLADFFRKWEGGLSRDRNDSASKKTCPVLINGQGGYHTNKGVTYETWCSYFGEDQAQRFIDMTDCDWNEIFKNRYWDRVKADQIKSDSIAACLVSWAWGSGAINAVKQIQKVLGVKVDGMIGNQTLSAINTSNEDELFDRCIKARGDFFKFISNPDNAKTEDQRVRFTKNKKFLKGWLNRLKEFEQEFKP